MAWLAALTLLAAVAGAAVRYGVDSRDGCDWRPRDVVRPHHPVARRHTPSRDLARLVHALLPPHSRRP